MPVTPILQFGTSRFLQAHADLFVSEAMARDEALGPITIVQSSGDVARARRLVALTDPEGFPVRIEGLAEGAPARHEIRVTSVARALSTERDWPEIVRIAVEEANIILSNTGDQGYRPAPADEGLAYDQAMSFPAKLTLLLAARHAAGAGGLQVMPTELVAENGRVLRDRVLTLARHHGAALADWIAAEVLFVNSLVDRIVSEPLEPAGAVAEPYALWAIQQVEGMVLPCTHPCVQVFADLGPVERRKLHILNLGHSYLVSRWLGSGRQPARVRDMMDDPAIRADLESLYRDEVLPVFRAAGDAEAPAYVATTLDRFANPFLAHKLADIADNHAQKLDRRLRTFLEWGTALGVVVHQPRLVRALASGAASA